MVVKFTLWTRPSKHFNAMVDIAKLFTDLCSITSPSGCEAQTALWLKRYLKSKGLTTWRDAAGLNNDSNTGNLYALLKVNSKLSTVVLSAHMDTVAKKGDVIKPVIKKGNVSSMGDTILGADNRAGIVAILKVVEEIDITKLQNNLLLFFPTREEQGRMGSSFFTPTGKIKYIFNVDEGLSPGNFIHKSLGYINFKIIVNGKSAHAAKDYDKGVNAILVASKLVTSIRMGRNIKEGWTLNIGKIGGGANTNAVCDHVELAGELRAFSKTVMESLVSKLSLICKKIARSSGAKIKLVIDRSSYIAPFMGESGGKLAQICSLAAKRSSLAAKFNINFSTSDANAFSGLGYPVISVARGGKYPHSHRETIKLSDIAKTVKLLKEILYLS